ncbi:pentatricopeptide repeat-containing protein At1g53600, mitochondrial-like [Medicago truncatula]|uniref:pentatricopeptide repeat-containing protein At1g53600, mitochondrial-like n=1 Tax=Medicago truncatula TaxID=3880 RepID=UPI000D2F255D|nr:pentatricopeptide repeat-containing protein At1g53600, mitochondrial-like [Medicago truncatula]
MKFHHARNIHQQITNLTQNQTNIANGSKFITECNVKISENGRNGNVNAAETIFNKMSQKNIVTWTAMLVVYAKNGQIINARKLFDKMPERTTATYNAMISGYIRNGCNVTKAYELFTSFNERNAVSYAAMIMGETNEALRVFENVGESKRDVVSWSAVVVGLCRDGRIGYARKLFDRMPERNVVSWSAMIDGYMEKGLFENGFGFFLEMRREGVVEVNSTTMTIMIKGCGNCGGVKDGMQIHGLVSRLGFEFGSVLSNTIITMYSLFGCTDMAKKVF